MSERIGRPKAWSVGLAAMLLAGASVPALAQSPAASTGTTTSSVKKIAYISPEQANDYGWKQQGGLGAQDGGAQIGADIEMADGSGYDDPTPILHQLGDNGAQFIIAQ